MNLSWIDGVIGFVAGYLFAAISLILAIVVGWLFKKRNEQDELIIRMIEESENPLEIVERRELVR